MKIVKLVFCGLVLAALAACSSTVESLGDTPGGKEEQAAAPASNVAVGFGAYLNRTATRSGAVGELTTSTTDADIPKVSLENEGFGVMGYLTQDAVYDPTCKPNFMYNQQVTWLADPGVWEYTPVTYWPNNSTDSGSETTDLLSFFAYAPWVDVTAATGKVADGDDEKGIVALTGNTAAGDPRVRYTASLKPYERVDFCWADPKTDLEKPASTDSKVSLTFNHALASLNLLIDAYVDDTDGTNTLAGETRVWVRSVTIEGFTTAGSFSLNQKKPATGSPEWNEPYTAAPVSNEALTVLDGRSDGLEGKSESKNERPLGLNPVLLQSMTYSDLESDYDEGNTLPVRGVYNDTRNLFDVSSKYGDADKPTTAELTSTQTAPLYVIPTDRPLRITIAYDIETQAPNLPGYLADGTTHGISVKNVISTTVKAGGSDLYLESGKNYTVRLHLGINSVQYAATVTPWGESADPEEIDIPIEDLSINEIMLGVYVNPWDEQDEVMLSVPMSDLKDLATYFKAARTGDKDVSANYLGRNVDTNGNVEGVNGTNYDGTAVGRIAYISTDGTDVDASRPNSRILVMATKEAFGNTLYKWSEYTLLEGYTDITAVNGYNFTHKQETTTPYTTWDGTSRATYNDGAVDPTYYYPAARAVATFDDGNNNLRDNTTYKVKLAGATDWFLPSKQQMQLIGCNDGSTVGMASTLELGSGTFWCATEQDASTARCYDSGRWTVATKSQTYMVRPVFAY